uniref:NADH-ubiquinone oxidoreductase chain 4L n=1 Tax=Prostomis sp. PRO01 TaxID=1205644 RepID=A0A0S2MQ94_9CUCU|nr:NADH deshydrogenase subunit 4L [Prostomis sp. PRO01]
MTIYGLASGFMFFSGILVFSLKRKHLLLMLLSLELIVLSIYYNLFVYLMLLNDYFFVLIFLTFSVCAGVTGLSVLVSLIRTHGNDYFQSFSVLW